MKHLIFAICAGLLLAGCASKAEQAQKAAAEERAECLSLGFELGSEGYGNCRMQMRFLREQKRANAIAGFNASINAGNSARDSYYQGLNVGR